MKEHVYVEMRICDIHIYSFIFTLQSDIEYFNFLFNKFEKFY